MLKVRVLGNLVRNQVEFVDFVVFHVRSNEGIFGFWGI